MTTKALPSEPEIRATCGLSVNQWARLTGALQVTPVQLLRDYEAFTKAIQKRIDDAFRRPAFVLDDVEYLSTEQTCVALGVDAFHLSTMRARKKLVGLQHGRRVIYSREAMAEFMEASEKEADRKSSLVKAFIRFVEQKHGLD